MNREKIYAIIDGYEEGNRLSVFYNYFMMITIIISLIPLAFKNGNTVFTIFDKITVVVFIFNVII